MAPKVEGSSPFNHLKPGIDVNVDFGFFYFLRCLRRWERLRGDFESGVRRSESVRSEETGTARNVEAGKKETSERFRNGAART